MNNLRSILLEFLKKLTLFLETVPSLDRLNGFFQPSLESQLQVASQLQLHRTQAEVLLEPVLVLLSYQIRCLRGLRGQRDHPYVSDKSPYKLVPFNYGLRSGRHRFLEQEECPVSSASKGVLEFNSEE